MIKKFTEQELAKIVVDALEADGWTTYKEVHLSSGKIIDIVAVKDNIYWAIETKNKYGSAVLAQAYAHLHWFNKVSVAVPNVCRSRGDGKFIFDYFARNQGIGVFNIVNKCYWKGQYHWMDSGDYTIEQIIVPKVKDTIPNHIQKFLFDEQKQSIAGSTAGGCITPYGLTVIKIKKFLQEKGPSTIVDIVKNVKHHYGKDATARQCLSQYLTQFDDEILKKEEDGKVLYYLKELQNVLDKI
jgi:hypothetical protein